METITLLSESEMATEQKRNDDHQINNILKSLEVEMRLRGFSQRTTKTYLYYNSKFLEHINNEEKLKEERYKARMENASNIAEAETDEIK